MIAAPASGGFIDMSGRQAGQNNFFNIFRGTLQTIAAGFNQPDRYRCAQKTIGNTGPHCAAADNSDLIRHLHMRFQHRWYFGTTFGEKDMAQCTRLLGLTQCQKSRPFTLQASGQCLGGGAAQQINGNQRCILTAHPPQRCIACCIKFIIAE